MTQITTDLISELLEKRDEAKEAYYESGELTLTDTEFNELDRELEAMGYQETVGTSLNAKVDHECPMPSLAKENIELGKVFDDENYQNIIKHFNNGAPSKTLSAEFKYDGLAVELVFENGEFIRAVTRGNKLKGRDVTYNVGKLIPHVISDKNVISIRCEIVILDTTFATKYEPEGDANARTTASGIIRSEKLDEPRMVDIFLIPEDLVYRKTNGEFYSKTINREICAELGDRIIMPWNITIENTSKSVCTAYLRFLELREGYPVQIDGIVLKKADEGVVFEFNGHDVYNAISIKFPSKVATSTVTGLKWVLNKQGYYWPTLLIKPVEVDGRMMTKCSGYNLRYLKERNISIGAVVEIEIRGDVIPACTKVITPSIYKLSKTYPKDAIEGEVHLISENSDFIKKIRFIQGMLTLGLKGVGPAIAQKCADACGCEITQLFKPEIELIGLGAGEKEKVRNGINIIRPNLTILSAIRMLGLDGLNGKLATAIARERSGLVADFRHTNSKHRQSATDGAYFETIEDTIELLYYFDVDVKDLVEEVYANPVIKVVMTESPKKFGFETKTIFVNSIKKYTLNDYKDNVKDADYVICANPEGKTGKLGDARKYGTRILSYSEAVELFEK